MEEHMVEEGLFSNVVDKLKTIVGNTKSKVDDKQIKSKAEKITAEFLAATKAAKVKPSVVNVVGWLKRFESLTYQDIKNGFSLIGIDVSSLLIEPEVIVPDAPPPTTTTPPAPIITPPRRFDVKPPDVKDLNGNQIIEGVRVTVLTDPPNSPNSMTTTNQKVAAFGFVSKIDGLRKKCYIRMERGGIIIFSFVMISFGYVMVGEYTSKAMREFVNSPKIPTKPLTAGLSISGSALLEARWRNCSKNVLAVIEGIGEVVDSFIIEATRSLGDTILNKDQLVELFMILLYTQRAKKSGFDIADIANPHNQGANTEAIIKKAIDSIDTNTDESATEDELDSAWEHFKRTAPSEIVKKIERHITKVKRLHDQTEYAVIVAFLLYTETMLQRYQIDLVSEFVDEFYDHMYLSYRTKKSTQ